jgi:hypothetical protein
MFYGKWLSLVEHLVWDQGVAGSNPVFPTIITNKLFGALAQLGERLPCTQEVSGSIPLSSTISENVSDIFFFIAKKFFEN